jgi:D-alanyl-D-alanine carboxypeptidase
VILAAALGAGLLWPSGATARPALLFDSQSGRVLYAEDYDDLWHPASLTKIMTAYLTFEALKSGQLTLETKARYSEAAFAQPPSKIGLSVGAEMAIDTALRALIIKSANDIAVLLAEAVSGTEAQFVEKMNATAARLGMSRTKFVNASGLPAVEQVTTARDLARLARAVVRDFPEYSHYWSMLDMRLGKARLGTHNQLLKTFEGADGMKTGFICDSGYNLVASATRDGVRLMAVVLGERTGSERAIRAQSLLEHGFNAYGWKSLFNSQTIDDAPTSDDAKGITSIRNTVMAGECGNSSRVRRVIVARQKAKEQRKKTAESAADGNSVSPESAPSQAKADAGTGSVAKASGAAPRKAKPKPSSAAATSATASKSQ